MPQDLNIDDFFNKFLNTVFSKIFETVLYMEDTQPKRSQDLREHVRWRALQQSSPSEIPFLDGGPVYAFIQFFWN